MRKLRHSKNYKAFFVLGMSLFAVGIATKIYALSIAGFVFLIISLENKNKWQKK